MRDAPSTSDFGWIPYNTSGFHPFSPSSASKLPLHLKDVGDGVNYDKIASLYVDHFETKEFFLRQRRWAEDDTLYASLLKRKVPTSRTGSKKLPRFAFDNEDTEMMLNRKYDLIAAENPRPLAFCDGWPRFESDKDRRRPLFEPHINDLFSKQANQFMAEKANDLDYMRQSTTAEVRSVVRKTRFSLQFDFASWFDQLLLSPKVRRYFGLLLPSGQYAQLRAMPMGFRASCALAQAITWVLVDFIHDPAILRGLPRSAITVDTCIDNVRFCSTDRDLLQRVGAEFVRRCNHVGAILNEFDPTFPPQTEYDWLGVHYNHAETEDDIATRSLSAKTKHKLELAAAVLTLSSPTKRQMAAVYGILYFATDVMGPRMFAHYYSALRFYRTYIAAAEMDQSWDEHITLPTEIRNDLSCWVQAVSKAPPAPVVNDEVNSYDIILVTDASHHGWGAIALDMNAHSLHVCGGPWGGSDHLWNLSRSPESEPLGILKGICRFVNHTHHRNVLILTDHIGVLNAMNQGHGYTAAYNHLVLQCAQLFPGTNFVVSHIPGTENPADPISRGVSLPTDLHSSPLVQHQMQQWADEAATRERKGPTRKTGHGVWMV